MEEYLLLFADDLDAIKNEAVREFTKHALRSAPAYFWEIPASSSGKFHAKQSLGRGGLVRHTKMAARIFLKLVRPDLQSDALGELESDLGLAAVLLHDTYKRGDLGNQQYCKEHGAVAAAKTYQLGLQWLESQAPDGFTEGHLRELCGCICWHMGPWSTPTAKGVTKSYNNFSVLERLVHQADIVSTERTFKMTDIVDPEGVGVG